MPNTIYTKPFTQIVEDVMLEMREANFADSKIEKKYQRRVNDVYQRTIPAEYEFWDFLKKRGSITLEETFSSGTVTVTENSATVTHSTSSLTASAYIGYWFTIPSTNEVYEITANTTSTFTISPAYVGDSGSGLSFRVFKTVYTLPSDYEYMTTEPGFWFDVSTGRQYLDWDDDRDWARNYTTQTSQVPYSIREYTEKSTGGLYQVEISPPVTATRLLRFEYFRALPEMREFTTGTATTTANNTSVTLSADYSAYVSAGQYFRTDTDGTWKRINSVSGATLTLATGYPTAGSAVAYTISDAPEVPQDLQMAIFYGACVLTAAEQGETQINVTFHAQMYKQMIANAITKQNKKRYGRKVLRMSAHPVPRRLQ